MEKNIVRFITGVLFLGAASAYAGEKVVVIVNEANNQVLTAADLKNMYSDVVTHWKNGETITLYDLPVKDAARESFSEKVLGMPAGEVAREWANRKITNTAKNPPQTNKELVIPRLVAKNPNAIGYVSEETVAGKEGIKIVLTIE